MRALPVALALLLAVGSFPLASAILPAECTNGNATTSVNFVWTPRCLRITSGDTITFASVDTVPHNARSSQDTMVTLPGVTPCFQTPNFDSTRTTQVRFTHDSNGVTASLRNPDGTFGPVRECDLAEDPISALAGNEAIIAFECGVHQSMTGTIRVAMLG